MTTKRVHLECRGVVGFQIVRDAVNAGQRASRNNLRSAIITSVPQAACLPGRQRGCSLMTVNSPEV